MKRALALLVAVVELAGLAWGQETSIRGRVRDAETGALLAQANVALTGTAKGAATDQDGAFALTGLEPGRYTVVTSYLGYQTARQEVALGAGENRRLTIALTPKDVAIDEVTVTDQSEEVEARNVGVAELSAREIKQLPAVLEPDIFRALQLLPGVKSASDYSSGLYIRGGSPDQTLVRLDRTTVYSPSHFFGFFSTFNPDAIENVRLYKGGYPAEYGGRLGSVVSLTSKNGSRQEVSGTASVGLLASRAALEGPHPWGSWMVAVRRSTLEPLLGALGNLDIDSIPDRFYFYDVNGKVRVEASEKDRFALAFYLGSDALNLALFENEAQLDLTYGNRTASANWTHLFSDRLFSDLTLTASHYDSKPTFDLAGTPISQRVVLDDYSAKGDVDFSPNAQHTLEAGFRSGHFSFRYEDALDGNVTFSPRLRSFYSNAYVQETYEPSPRWQVQVGLRANYFVTGRHLRLGPRLSLEYRPTATVRLQAGYGRYHQFLTLVSQGGFSGFDFWLTAGEEVPPAYGDQFVAGVKSNLSSSVNLDLEAYYRTMNDLFEQDPFLADPAGLPYRQLFQFGTGYAYGTEVLLEKTGGRVNGFLAYTLGHTRRRFPQINGGEYYPPKYDRTHDVNLVLNYDFARTWRATGVFTYATGQAYTQPTGQFKLLNDPFQSSPRDLLVAPFNSARLPAYHRLDLGFAKRGRFFGLADYEAQFQVINVYGRRNIWFYAFQFTNTNTVEREVVPQIPVPLPNLSFTLEF